MIGVFDSGVGGLSVWREVVKLMSREHIVYLADQAYVPYGLRPLEEVRALTLRCVRWLVERGCDVVVIACNTASGAALDAVRHAFPATPIVGMEPAVKPAALQTKTGVIGVLATETTFKSTRYADLIRKWADGLRVIEQPCLGWVEFIEQGHVGVPANSPAVPIPMRPLNTGYVTALLHAQADVIVLGCTHFPFLNYVIWNEIESWYARHPGAARVSLINPAPAVAQQTLRVREQLGTPPSLREFATLQPRHEFWTTGDADGFERVASNLLAQPVKAQGIVLNI